MRRSSTLILRTTFRIVDRDGRGSAPRLLVHGISSYLSLSIARWGSKQGFFFKSLPAPRSPIPTPLGPRPYSGSCPRQTTAHFPSVTVRGSGRVSAGDPPAVLAVRALVPFLTLLPTPDTGHLGPLLLSQCRSSPAGLASRFPPGQSRVAFPRRVWTPLGSHPEPPISHDRIRRAQIGNWKLVPSAEKQNCLENTMQSKINLEAMLPV
jgi:hypothetical protein